MHPVKKYKEIVVGDVFGLIITFIDISADSINVTSPNGLSYYEYWEFIEHFLLPFIGLILGFFWWRTATSFRQITILNQKLDKQQALSNLLLDLMSHDINNYNQVALTNAELLQQTTATENVSPNNEFFQKYLNGFHVAVKQSTHLIYSIGLLKQIETQRFDSTPTQIFPLIELAKEEVSQLFVQKNLNIAVNYKNDHLTINGHEILKQIFINLFINSVKHRKSDQQEIKVDISVKKENQYAIIEVGDRGSGIPDHLKEKIFNRFSIAKNEDKGSGIGLSISRRLAEYFNGNLWVQNRHETPDEYSTGSLFVLCLPLAIKGH